MTSVLHRLPQTSRVNFQALEEIEWLDEFLYQHEDVFAIDRAEADDLIVRASREALAHHYGQNPRYAAYCEHLGFDPDELRSVDDLSRIPLLTSSQFKMSQVLTGGLEDVVKECTSSGTSGSISRIFRDEATLCRFLGSIRTNAEQLIKSDDGVCLHLGPPKDEAGDLWFSYVMGTTDLIFPTEHFVKDGTFQPAHVIERLLAYRGKHENRVLIGAPILFMHLLNHLEEAGRSLPECEDLVVITAGGWKRFSGQSIPRPEFEARLGKAFKGLRSENIRDFFNMVELNAVIAECEFKTKHAPPWLHCQTLDPKSLAPVASGEMGLFSFIDPTATSYPGFVLSDDFARVSRDDCACGRRGQTVEFIRRVRKGESRGCALKIDRGHR